MRTRYKIDDFQQSYFVIDSFDDLLAQTRDTDFAPLYAHLSGSDAIEPDAVLSTDLVHQHGTQDYAQAKAR
jgi:phenylalanine-4-hydroxylase